MSNKIKILFIALFCVCTGAFIASVSVFAVSRVRLNGILPAAAVDEGRIKGTFGDKFAGIRGDGEGIYITDYADAAKKNDIAGINDVRGRAFTS